MPKIDQYYDEIDAARIRRAKELSQVKKSFGQLTNDDPYGVASKAVVVLAYANWEGFYNECAQAYLRFLVEQGTKVRDRDWILLVAALNSDFESMRDRNHSLESRKAFVTNLQQRIECGFDAVYEKLIQARSNLDFARIAENFGLLSFDLSQMQKVRNRLDKELVGWRHAVAHGDSPDLSQMDIEAHIDFASTLLILIADHFQYAMMSRK